MGETAKTEGGPSKGDLLTVGQLNDRIDQTADSSTDLHVVRCVGEVMNAIESDMALYSTLTDGEPDLFYREQISDSPLTSEGVLGVSDRQTGEYLFEVRTSTAVIEEFAYAVRQYAEASGTPARYEVAL